MRTTAVNSEEVAKRFAQFRNQFIAKTQQEAAKFLNVSQPTINRFESGKAGLTVEVIRILLKSYHLNIDWLIEGKGRMQDKTETKSNIVTDINEMKADMFAMMGQVKMMQKNISAIGKQVDAGLIRQNERIEAMEDKFRETA